MEGAAAGLWKKEIILIFCFIKVKIKGSQGRLPGEENTMTIAFLLVAVLLVASLVQMSRHHPQKF